MKRCPACAEEVQANATVCRHCRSPLAPAPRGLSTPVIVALCIGGAILLLGLIAAITIPAMARAKRNARVVECQDNLSLLWKMEINYSMQYGGYEKRLPSRTGSSFWLKLSQPPTALLQPPMTRLYRCPLAGSRESCDYRGPAHDANALGTGILVGSDRDRNHGGEDGNVLFRSGEVRFARDELWRRASSETIP